MLCDQLEAPPGTLRPAVTRRRWHDPRHRLGPPEGNQQHSIHVSIVPTSNRGPHTWLHLRRVRSLLPRTNAGGRRLQQRRFTGRPPISMISLGVVLLEDVEGRLVRGGRDHRGEFLRSQRPSGGPIVSGFVDRHGQHRILPWAVGFYDLHGRAARRTRRRTSS